MKSSYTDRMADTLRSVAWTIAAELDELIPDDAPMNVDLTPGSSTTLFIHNVQPDILDRTLNLDGARGQYDADGILRYVELDYGNVTVTWFRRS